MPELYPAVKAAVGVIGEMAAEARATNPTSTTLLADTGAVTLAGAYECRVLVSADAASTIILAHRNAANDGDTSTVTLDVGPGFGQAVVSFNLLTNERVRVMSGGMTGHQSAAIQTRAL